LLAGFLIAVIYGAFMILRELRKKTPDSPLLVTALFFLITIVYVTVIGNCLEVGENERFRFNIDPLLLVLFGVFLTRSIERLGRTYRTEPESQSGKVSRHTKRRW